jgi:excisionase family DNA binding protein
VKRLRARCREVTRPFRRGSLPYLAAGHAVLALPVETRLTPAETAQLLGYSRPFVARLLDEGELPSEHLPGSTHRTVRLADVLEFQGRREHNAEGRRRIIGIVEDHDLPY